jgi:hypothetical protein
MDDDPAGGSASSRNQIPYLNDVLSQDRRTDAPAQQLFHGYVDVLFHEERPPTCDGISHSRAPLPVVERKPYQDVGKMIDARAVGARVAIDNETFKTESSRMIP